MVVFGRKFRNINLKLTGFFSLSWCHFRFITFSSQLSIEDAKVALKNSVQFELIDNSFKSAQRASSKSSRKMSQEKPTKPFLKKGTRQFLSNASVRSQSQKPKIVNFEDEQNNNTANHPTLIPSKQTQPFRDSKASLQKDVRDQDQIVISVVKSKTRNASNHKSTNKRALEEQQTPSSAKHQKKQKEEPGVTLEKKRQPSRQAKPTMLKDYLKSSSHKPKNTTSYDSRQYRRGDFSDNQQEEENIQSKKSKFQRVSSSNPLQSQALGLKMQMEDESSIQEREDSDSGMLELSGENEFIEITPEVSRKTNNQHQKTKKSLNRPNLLNEVVAKNSVTMPKQSSNQDAAKIEDSVKIQSDDSEDEVSNRRGKVAHKNATANRARDFRRGLNNQGESNKSYQPSRQDSESEQRTVENQLQERHESKVAQMFNKMNKKHAKQSEEQKTIPVVGKKVLRVEDVPKELIQEIVEKYFKEAKAKYDKKQQGLIEQVRVLERKSESLSEQEKTLQRRTKQFQKIMEEKQKDIENKYKAEHNKITREKMYLKDKQTSNKLDWKSKNELSELKAQLEEEKADKKRIEVKLRGELDRLKQRHNEEVQNKKLLEAKVREYQIKELKEMQRQKKEQKEQKKLQRVQKENFWARAPEQSQLQNLYSSEFSLMSREYEGYFYQQNQFYQYYKQSGESDELLSEEFEDGKIKRKYKNGKLEIESSKKFVKEVFPWGYIIVHYINGDVKQTISLPNKKKLQIYFSNTNKIIEYTITNVKTIHVFLSEDQVELMDQETEFKEVLRGNHLQQIRAGQVIAEFKKIKDNFVRVF